MKDWQGDNRRRFPRIMFPCMVVLKQAQNEEVTLTHTENIGVGGVCVTFKRKLKMFTPIELEIDLLDASEHIKCKGKVVWSIHRTGNNDDKSQCFDIGIEFEKIESQDLSRIQAAVDRLEKKSAASGKQQ